MNTILNWWQVVVVAVVESTIGCAALLWIQRRRTNRRRGVTVTTGWRCNGPWPQGQEEYQTVYKQMDRGQVKSQLHGEQLYKVVTANNDAAHGGNFTYTPHLPTRNADGSYAPGAWTPVIASPAICRQGYHLTTQPFGPDWGIAGGNVYEAVGRGAYSADGRDTLRITGDKIAFAEVRLLRPVDASVGALRQAKAVVADVGTIPFLSGAGHTRANWKLFPSERAANAAFQDAGGGKGYPAAKLADPDAFDLDDLLDASDSLADNLPADKQYAADAFPTNLAYCLAKWNLSGQPVPAELTDRLNAYRAGYGVSGRTANGDLYCFTSY